MKSIKRGIAMLLAAVLIIPNMPAFAEEPVPIIDFSTLETQQEEAPGADNTAGKQPSEETAADSSGAEQTSTDAAPAESLPSESSVSTEPISTESASGEPASTEALSSETSSSEATSTETSSSEATSKEAYSSEAASTEASSSETSSSEVASTEASSSEASSTEDSTETGSTEAVTETELTTETETDLTELTTETAVSTATEIETEEEETLLASELEEVFFNTGNKVMRVSNEPLKGDIELNWDEFRFDENGAFTIHIPEQNPFFPYEVQFTYEGETSSKWFMTPEDCVEIGGHPFYVAAEFDGNVVTRMNLNVSGTKVVVYPKAKEFTDDAMADGKELYSLLPLEHGWLTADLTTLTPVELTMVSLSDVFTSAGKELKDTDKIMWVNNSSSDDYTISSPGDKLDLSYDTCWGGDNTWQMIVGSDDQLDMDNKRYTIYTTIDRSQNWLNSIAYKQDIEGNRKEIRVVSANYYDGSLDKRELSINLSGDDMAQEWEAYIALSVNPSVFNNVRYADLKVYEGQFATAEEAQKGKDITSQILSTDMAQKDAGYLVRLSGGGTYITFVSYDAAGNVTGCLPVQLYTRKTGNYLSRYSLFQKIDTDKIYVEQKSSWEENNCIILLKKGMPADGKYCLKYTYYKDDLESNSSVTAAYIGKYDSIAAAQEVNAPEVRELLFSDAYDIGYEADYSQGVTFSIFIGEDGSEKQESYCYTFKTVEDTSQPVEPQTPDLRNSKLVVNFTGLKDQEGNSIKRYLVNYEMDSYSSYEYITMIVTPETDLTNVAPEFEVIEEYADSVNLYVPGSSAPEESGKSCHDFSNGPVQYTATTQLMVNGQDYSKAKNYWLQIIKADEGAGKLYVNSLKDEDSKTREENGVIYSKREVMIDGYHGDVHDILVVNMGTEALTGLTTELLSDVLELDDYWKLKGQFELSGYKTIYREESYGELPNMAKIRLRAKEGKVSTSDNLGTLTIKSGDQPIMVFELTGSVGDPHITTQEIPKAVKYVPYGSMIQNSNKYDWNTVTYSVSGNLPANMQVLQSGELYGVPRQAGKFDFTVTMHNSYSGFKDYTKAFTIEVLDNTDKNVEDSTDVNYNVTQRIPDIINITAIQQEYLFVSEGQFKNFKYVYLDSIRLDQGRDFEVNEGSTRITIKAETLDDLDDGTHTLGVEFREEQNLKSAAQNFKTEGKKKEEDNKNEDNKNEDNKGEDNKDEGNKDEGNKDEDNKGEDNKDENNKGDGNKGDKNHGNKNEGTNDNSDSDNSNGGSSSSSNNTSSQPSNTNANTNVNTNALQPNVINPNSIVTDAANSLTTPTDVSAPVNYIIESGDTLWKIAVKFYGNGNYWRKIYEDNADTISNPDRIFAGQAILIYPLQDALRAPLTNPNAANTVQIPQTDNTAADSTDINSYVVQPGDNLWKIARKRYGRGWRWRTIYEANTDTLPDPGQLHAGQVLIIPN